MTDSDHNTEKRGHVRTRRAPKAPTVTINVTQEVIDNAERSESRTCMISVSIVAQVPRATNVLTDAATIRWSDPDKGLRYTYLTPQSVRDALLRFDNGEHVEAFSFTLRGKFVLPSPQHGSKKRMPMVEWKKVKERVKEIRVERKLDWDTIANQIDIPTSTLKTMVRINNDDPPSGTKMDKIENWVLEQTGEAPAPRIKTQADQVRGPAQFRSPKSTKRAEPEIIGGPPFPVSQTTRTFGLRMFRAK
jgi:hypothetical protein